MAEIEVEIKNIKIKNFLNLCNKYNYVIPKEFKQILNQHLEREVTVGYGDEYCFDWDLQNDLLIVKNILPFEMLQEIKLAKRRRKRQKHLYNETNDEIQMIFELVKSLNHENWESPQARVNEAIKQYEQFKRKVINKRKED